MISSYSSIKYSRNLKIYGGYRLVFNINKSRLAAISDTIIPVIGYITEKRSPQNRRAHPKHHTSLKNELEKTKQKVNHVALGDSMLSYFF
jgi:hypothetical protein